MCADNGTGSMTITTLRVILSLFDQVFHQVLILIVTFPIFVNISGVFLTQSDQFSGMYCLQCFCYNCEPRPAGLVDMALVLKTLRFDSKLNVLTIIIQITVSSVCHL